MLDQLIEPACTAILIASALFVAGGIVIFILLLTGVVQNEPARKGEQFRDRYNGW